MGGNTLGALTYVAGHMEWDAVLMVAAGKLSCLLPRRMVLSQERGGPAELGSQ